MNTDISNEVRKEYLDDIKSKKIISQSATKKVSHSGRNKTLRYDQRTKEEESNLSGPVNTYVLKPMTFAEFNQMPEVAKVRYVEVLRDEYDATLTAIRKMLGVPRCSTFDRFCKDHGLTFQKTNGRGKSNSFYLWLSENTKNDAGITDKAEKEKDKPCVNASAIQDSGDRTEFPSGAVRDMGAGKGDMVSMPWVSLLRLSKHYENGAKKYGQFNYQKGIPTSSFIDSAQRHIAKYLSGCDDEDHLSAAVFNILGAMFTENIYPDLNDLPAREGKKAFPYFEEEVENHAETDI